MLVVVLAGILSGSIGTAAHAQSSVTLYGVLDGALLYTSKTLSYQTGADAGKQFSMTDGGIWGSRLGMKGTEDLGGGLKVLFVLESGINVSNGGFANSNGNLFGRQAWIGLDGKFGTAKAGLQYSPFFLSLFESDPRAFSQFGSGLINYLDNVLVTGLFNANSVSYTSPTIAGLQGSAMLALGGEAGNFQAGRQYSVSLKYTFKGLMINAALYSGNAGGTAATTPVPSAVQFTGHTVGAAYDFGKLTLDASFVSYKVAGSFDNHVYGGGFSYGVTPALNVNGGVWFTQDRNDTSNHSILAAVGSEIYLSKRTTLYGQVGFVRNHGAMDTGLSINGALYGVTGSTVGANVGIRHLF
ncbi:porin [Paraburkholderia sp. CNPSo 3076]|uniref:porin n=1 Tax=Paraburkholderia sp. CNPSo 3076 TaxID=2940936 RepID=UPI0022571BD0|nr:porin [Paraburkholderia sp. CNPSo 3076]MCX5540069.1 porin [Paraburkholderia sp. CNPSo 3076]